MRLRNEGFCISLGLLLIANDCVHEEQLNFMERLSRRYNFSMDFIWDMMRQLDQCCEDIHTKFSQESFLVRYFYKRDIIKLACLDGALDEAEEKIILQTTGMARQEYERKATKYLDRFRRKVRHETFLRHIKKVIYGLLHSQVTETCSLEKCIEEYRVEIAPSDQSSSLLALLDGYTNGITNSGLNCKDAVLEEIRNLSDRIKAIREHSDEITVAMVGKTKAGKSTLFNALMESKFDRLIGEGKQGTTKLVRVGHWHGIRLIDTPGLGAIYAGGRNDEAVTEEALHTADFLLAVIPGDTQEAGMEDFYLECEKTGKPVFYVQNVKRFLNKSKRVLTASIQNPNAWRQAETYDENFRTLERYFARRGLYKSLFGRSCIVSYSREMMSGHIGCVEGSKDVLLTQKERSRVESGSGFPEFALELEKFVREYFRFACANRYFTEIFGSISVISKLLAENREMLSVRMSEITMRRDEALTILDREKSLCVEQFRGELLALHSSDYGDAALEKRISTQKIKRKNFVAEAETICEEIRNHADSLYRKCIAESGKRIASLTGDRPLKANGERPAYADGTMDGGEWAGYVGQYTKKIGGTAISIAATIGATVLGTISLPIAVPAVVLAGGALAGNLVGEQLSKDITIAGIQESKRREILDKLRRTVERSFEMVESGYTEVIGASFAGCRDGCVKFFREQAADAALHMETVSDSIRRLQEMQDAAERLRASCYLRAAYPKAQYIGHKYDANSNTMTICAKDTASTRLNYPGLTIEIKEEQ